ncbi:MAG TPA: AtpZ/AtpI family protein [Bryobacteraceae bacterium]|nr:AtpZ/AtpI family protein [Bryobacteraceae bacterium]
MPPLRNSSEPPIPKDSGRPDRPFLWFGKYLSLALTLPACVAAGYLLGAVATHWVQTPLLRVAGIFLGMAAGIIQVIRELSRDSKRK